MNAVEIETAVGGVSQLHIYSNNRKLMASLTTLIKKITFLNCTPGATLTEATKRKALHKPFFLLAVLDDASRRHCLAVDHRH